MGECNLGGDQMIVPHLSGRHPEVQNRQGLMGFSHLFFPCAVPTQMFASLPGSAGGTL